jgi:hypothetical protein
MKVAIIHYWLVGMRGGEKVVEALGEMYPQADIFTHVYVPEMVSGRIRQHRIIPTFINALPRAARMYKTYLPLMPLALEQLDLRSYDLIISSESGPSKGIIAPSEALHVCYCHTPMRYIWNMYHDYRNSAGRVARLMMPPLGSTALLPTRQRLQGGFTDITEQIPWSFTHPSTPVRFRSQPPPSLPIII